MNEKWTEECQKILLILIDLHPAHEAGIFKKRKKPRKYTFFAINTWSDGKTFRQYLNRSNSGKIQ